MAWVEFPTHQDYFSFVADRLVSKWPHPNTDRIQCAFRMQLGDGVPYPRPGRFILAMEDVPDEPDGLAYPVIEMKINGDFRLRGVSGVNELGREVVLDIIQHLDDDFDGSDFPGIEYAFTFKMFGFDDFHTTLFYEWTHPGGINNDINYRSDNGSNDPIPLVFVEDITELNVDWPAPPSLGPWNFSPMSECYVFPAPPFDPAGAEFNGIDAYIALDHFLPSVNAPFIWEAQIKFNAIAENPFFGVASSGGFIGFRDDNDFTIGNIRPDPTWDANLDQWYLIRLQFEQTGQLKYELFVDDVDVWTAVSNRQNFAINRLGVYKQGVAGTLWSDLSMRNLKWWVGSVPSTDLVLDMPLVDNALDLSVEENHGTPFNMDLPAT